MGITTSGSLAKFSWKRRSANCSRIGRRRSSPRSRAYRRIEPASDDGSPLRRSRGRTLARRRRARGLGVSRGAFEHELLVEGESGFQCALRRHGTGEHEGRCRLRRDTCIGVAAVLGGHAGDALAAVPRQQPGGGLASLLLRWGRRRRLCASEQVPARRQQADGGGAATNRWFRRSRGRMSERRWVPWFCFVMKASARLGRDR